MTQPTAPKSAASSAPPVPLTFRKALLSDVRPISAIVKYWAQKAQMLPRDDENIATHIREFTVAATPQGEIVGCGALHIYGIDMAEIRSLAVADGWTGRGIGQDIVKDNLREAKEFGLKNVFALTYSPNFFERLGFEIVEKSMLPHKIWKDCLYCSKFNDCNEIAVLKILPKD